MNPAITYPFRVVNIDYLLLEFYMLCFAVFFLELPRHPKSTLFPYTTLFRSQIDASPLPIRRNPFDRGQTPPLHSGKVQRSDRALSRSSGRDCAEKRPAPAAPARD